MRAVKHDAAGKAARMLEVAPDAMILVDGGGTIVVINFGAEQLFGYTRDELVGQPIEVLVPEAAALSHVGRRDHYMSDPTTRHMGSRMNLSGRRKDGSMVPVEIALSPMADADGVFVVAAVRDISERLAAEHSLRESEERLAAAARGANLGLWDVGAGGHPVMINPIFESMLGYEPLALRETDDSWSPLRGGLPGWIEILHPEDRDRVTTLIRQYLAGEADTYRAEQRARRPDGSYAWILSVGNTVTRNDQGRPLRINGVHIDITDMKRLEHDLRAR